LARTSGEWSGTAYVRAAPVVNASQINAASLSAISANLGSVTAGAMNIAGKFVVLADGTYQLNGTSASYLAGGQSGFNTGIGYYLGFYNGAHVLSIGDPNKSFMEWDGDMLRVNAPAKYSAGNSLLFNVPGTYSQSNTTDVKKVAIYINEGYGVVRLIFTMSHTGSGSDWVRVKTYVDGAEVDSKLSTTTPYEYTVDVTVAQYSKIELSVASRSSTVTGSISNITVNTNYLNGYEVL
jgi:hypothetical protein